MEYQRSIETVADGFVTPTRVTGVPGELIGCVYRADGGKVALSERFGGHRGDMLTTANPDRMERPEGARVLKGRGLYLGHFMGGHYGHFITETLSTFWILDDLSAAGFDYVLFHPFIFGTTMRDYATRSLSAFGIDPSRVVFAESGPLAVEELVVPERLLRLNHSVDPHLRGVYQRIAGGLARPEPPTERLYLSRRRLNARRVKRVVANEVSIEAIFAARGFTVLYPEEMSFEEQLRRYANAAALAGPSGSALHNSLFAREGARVVELGDPRYRGEPSPTQMLCDSVAGVRADFIPFVGREFGRRRTMIFDTRYLEAELDRIGFAPTGDGPTRSSPLQWARDTREVLYRCVRPTIRGFASATYRRLRPRIG